MPKIRRSASRTSARTITNNLQTFEIPTNGESVSLNPYLDTGRRFMPKAT